MTAAITPAALAAAGAALYGPRWQSQLARDLGISSRTMRRWTAGHSRIPPAVGPEIRALLRARAEAIAALP